MPDPIDFAALGRLDAAATPGPWTRKKPANDSDGWPTGVAVAGTPGRQTIYATPSGGSFPSSDCDLIAAARNALPDLLAVVVAAKALADAVNGGKFTRADDLLPKLDAALARFRNVSRGE